MNGRDPAQVGGGLQAVGAEQDGPCAGHVGGEVSWSLVWQEGDLSALPDSGPPSTMVGLPGPSLYRSPSPPTPADAAPESAATSCTPLLSSSMLCMLTDLTSLSPDCEVDHFREISVRKGHGSTTLPSLSLTAGFLGIVTGAPVTAPSTLAPSRAFSCEF